MTDEKKDKLRYRILGGICVLFIIVGCFFIYESQRLKVCRDPDILSLLKNDPETPEFVLDGDYYVLPAPLSEFLDNGWELILAEEEKELELKMDQYRDNLRLMKNGRSIGIDLWNNTEETLEIGNPKLEVTRISLGSSKKYRFNSDKNFFVTKEGIMTGSETRDIELALTGKDYCFFEGFNWFDDSYADITNKENVKILYIEEWSEVLVFEVNGVHLKPYQRVKTKDEEAMYRPN